MKKLDIKGDGFHWGLTDPYPEVWAEILNAVASGEDFDSGWLGCKKELRSARIVMRGGEVEIKASATNDIDSNGYYAVVISKKLITNARHLDLLLTNYLEVAESGAEKASKAELDAALGFWVLKKNRTWVDTYLEPRECYLDSPPGDCYNKWGWQEESEVCDCVRKLCVEAIRRGYMGLFVKDYFFFLSEE